LPPTRLPRRQDRHPTAGPAAGRPHPPRGLHAAVLTQLVMAKVPLLRTLLAGINDLDRAIKKHLATHPKAQLLATLPYAGQVSLAQLLAELGPSWTPPAEPTKPPPRQR